MHQKGSNTSNLPFPYYNSVGGRVLSSSSLSSGFVRAGAKVAASSGLITLNEGEEQLPLSIILADGNIGVMDTEGEKSLGGDGGGVRLKFCYKSWKKEEIGGTTVVWRDSASSWVFRRMELKVKY